VRTRLPAPQGRLTLDQIGLRAPDGRTILVGISLEVSPGEVLAVIGPSGSGKTSLAKILVGVSEPTVGTVRIDSARLSDWDPDDLGRHIGYMSQQPSLLEGTVRDNICRFNGGPADTIDTEVIAAAKLAGVHDLILHLPNGYQTMLGSMGNGVSAGQSQRIALARALFGAPELLVLDEPNSWLDSDGEVALEKAVKSVRSRGGAVVIAAHRKSILGYTDRILVLDSGRPRLLGKAAEVVAKLAAKPQSETTA
jgi:ABC-type protease/lipase transport system fused ATPase/permease subunit